MKKLSNILVKISNLFCDMLPFWIENNLYDFSIKIGIKFYKLARKIYPDNFCRHCNHFLELCYHAPLKDPPEYICCNCQGKAYEEQYKH